MSGQSRRTGRIVRLAVILLVIVAITLYLLLPVAAGVFATTRAGSAVGPPPSGFTPVTLQTEDGVELAAWYAAPQPENGAAILVLHGAGGSRDEMRGQAEMLAAHGYGVITFDARGHGASGGRINRLGWNGSQDVGAAVAYLAAQENITAVGGLGSSMGGEILLGASAAYPQLQAIVADGATHRSLAELLALPSKRPLYEHFTASVMFATVGLLSGEEAPMPLLEAMRGAPQTDFLLIAAGADGEEVEYNRLFAEAMGDRASLWIATDASHTAAYALYPEEYGQRVLDFFDRTLSMPESHR